MNYIYDIVLNFNKKYYSVAVFSRLECDAQGYFEWVTYYIEE